MKKIQNIMNKILAFLMIALFIVMVLVGSYQIIVRYFFNKPSTFSEELLTYTFTWMALLSAAYVFGQNDHMRMSFLVDKLSPERRKIIEIITQVVIMLFAAIVLIYGGIKIVGLTMSQITATLMVPMGYIYTVVPISGLFIVVYSIINIYTLVKKEGE